MHCLTSFFFGVFFALLLNTTAEPAVKKKPAVKKTGYVPPARGCRGPARSLDSLYTSFTLSTITDKDPIPWTVVISESRGENGYQPGITREVILEPTFQPEFHITNGKLSMGPASDNLTAYFGPSPAVWPPVLVALCFDDVKYEDQFFATYSCDVSGVSYLELRSFQRRDHLNSVLFSHSSILVVGFGFANTGLLFQIAIVVPKVKEGAKIYGKPDGSKGKTIKEIDQIFNEINF